MLEIYRYLHRFSIEKVKKFVDQPIFMFLFLQYIKQTEMMRVHKRNPMNQNIPSYYRAIENMINRSEFKNEIVNGGIQLVVAKDDFTINKDELSFQKLCDRNLSRDTQ